MMNHVGQSVAVDIRHISTLTENINQIMNVLIIDVCSRQLPEFSDGDIFCLLTKFFLKFCSDYVD